jgi:predicted metal-dependent hydrolase
MPASRPSLHPELTAARRAELVAEGAARFNRGEFFAAHESWEEVWRSTTPEPRDLFQGLVQVAAAFHHFADRRRPDVARRVMAKGLRRLAGCGDGGTGLDLERFLAETRRWEAWLADPVPPQPPYPDLATRKSVSPG